MKLERFVTNFSTSGNNKEKYVKDHIRSDYVSYADKVSDCERIVRACHYHDVDEKRRFRLNSPASAMMFTLVLVGRYTNIDLEYNVAEYDELQKCGALKVIISAIPEAEYQEYSAVMRMTEDDTVATETNVAARLDDMAQTINRAISVYSEFEIKDVE